MASADVRMLLAEHEPADRIIMADAERLDTVARAFAKVIDAKSPWTFSHSEQVAEIAGNLATILGMTGERRRRSAPCGCTWRPAPSHPSNPR